jgi:preprotein translocase subunit SecB
MTEAANNSSTPSMEVLSQYIRDLSVENPKISQISDATQEDIQLEIDVSAQKMQEDVYESSILFRLKIEKESTPLYLLELQYAGLFRIAHTSQEMLQLLLLVQCPHLLFPYMRALIATLTQESGLPPLNLQPIDFLEMLKRKANENQD